MKKFFLKQNNGYSFNCGVILYSLDELEEMNILWNEILELINNSSKKKQIEFIEPYNFSLVSRLGLEEDSVIGQIIANTKGIIIDNTVRILGSGEKNKYTSIEQYNYEVGKYLGNIGVGGSGNCISGIFTFLFE